MIYFLIIICWNRGSLEESQFLEYRCVDVSRFLFRTAESFIRWINYLLYQSEFLFYSGHIQQPFFWHWYILVLSTIPQFFLRHSLCFLSQPSRDSITYSLKCRAISGPLIGPEVLFWSWTFEIIQCKCIAVWILGLCWLLPGRSRFNGYEYEWWWNSWSCHDLPSHTMSFQKNDVGRRNVVMCCGVWCLMFIYY